MADSTDAPYTFVDLRGPATETPEAHAVRTSGDQSAERGWVTEHRNLENTKGIVTSRDGKTFEYDIEGLGEYAIESNRAKAVDKANKHFDTLRHAAQHDFANEKAASVQETP